MKLSALPAQAIDSRLTRRLHSGEAVLWQGAPAPGTFVSSFAPLMTAFTAIAGILMVVGYPPGVFSWLWSVIQSVPQANIAIAAENEAAATMLVGWFLFLTSAIGFLMIGYQREKHWVYAITSQRLLVLNHGKVRHSANREDVDQVLTRKKPFRGYSVYWSSAMDGFQGQKDPQAVQEIIELWRTMSPDEHPSTGTGDRAGGAHPSPTPVAGPDISGGFRLEKKPAVWIVVVGLVGAFGYWGYTTFLSGHEIVSQDLQAITPTDRPAELGSLPDGMPVGYWMSHFNLDPAANPMRAVLGMTVRRARETVNYRLVLLDENGAVAWESSGVAHHGASAEEKRQDREGSIRTKRMREATEPFTLERAGRYLLLADIDRVDNPRMVLRGKVTEASSLVYALFAVVALIGLGLLLRQEMERRRAELG